MKLKNIVNNDTAEIIKKLVHGLDFRTSYIVEFLHDGSVEVREVDIIRDKKTGKIICFKDKGWVYDNFTGLVIYIVYYYRFSSSDYYFNVFKLYCLFRFFNNYKYFKIFMVFQRWKKWN